MNYSAKTYDFGLLLFALADPTRLRLLNLMNGKEVCMCYFVEILGQSQPEVLRHLAYLRRAGIVAARREGTWMHYRVVVPKHAGAARVLSEMLSILSEDKTMQTDLTRLTRRAVLCRSLGPLSLIVSTTIPHSS